jgi:SAM-dependent methyltransferase
MALIQPSASSRYTYDFVTASLPSGARHILEIGCGDGALAALLQRDGLEVIGIDSDPAAVETARTAGVNARLVTWPAAMDAIFDAILFTRSLHHIHALDKAVRAAPDALRPGGRMIVEDFRAEGGGKAGERWFRKLASELIAAGAVDASLDELLEKLAPGDHGEQLHASQAIAEALGGFEVEAGDAAY